MQKSWVVSARCCALSSVCVALSGTAAAVEPIVQLPEQRIEARRILSTTLADLDSARAAMALTPGGASVIDAESFRDARVSTLQDALGYSAGVFVQPRFGSEESRLSFAAPACSAPFTCAASS